MDLDPTLLVAAGTVATITLTEAAGFLRDQASSMLQRRRDKTAVVTSELLDGPLELDTLSDDALEDNRIRLQQLWFELGPQPGDSEISEEDIRAKLDDLRVRLEAIVGRRITFIGEDRPRTGTPVGRSRIEGQRMFNVTGDRNIAIGGDHHGQITIGS